MNYDSMSLDKLKDYAKSIGISVGNIKKDKLIEKIKEKESSDEKISSVIKDDDLEDKAEDTKEPVAEKKESKSILESISSAIDELDDSTGGEIEEIVELPTDTKIPVKSITYGGLTYKSKKNNAIFRWNQIGAIEYMTVGELNEMNNYDEAFLRQPLVILMDERAIKKFRLTSVYENVAKINNLTELFKSDIDTIKKTIDDALSVNMRDILISKVRQMYKKKKLVDVNVIRVLQDKLQFDFLDDED